MIAEACINEYEVLDSHQPGHNIVESCFPLCTSLISSLLCLAGSKLNCTFPLVSGTKTKLLQHSDDLSTSNGMIFYCSVVCLITLWVAAAVHMPLSLEDLVWAAALLHLELECTLKTSNSCKIITNLLWNSFVIDLPASLSTSIFALSLKII